MPQRYDITLATIGGSAIGYMLNRDQRGHRGWGVKDAQTIAPRILTEDQITQAQLPPDLELTFPQDDWHRGIGGLTFRNHPAFLANDTRIDIIEEGVIKLARETTVTTVNSNPDEYVPSGFAVTGIQLWAFIGRQLFEWDFTNKNWELISNLVDSARIYRNGIYHNGTWHAPSWADDSLSSDVAVNYIYKGSGGTPSWTLVTNAAQTLDGCKYMAVANNLLWGGNWTEALTGTYTLNGTIDSSTTSIAINGGPIATSSHIRIDSEIMFVSAGGSSPTVVRGVRGSIGASHSDTTDIYTLSFANNAVRSTLDATSMVNWSTATTIGEDAVANAITGLVGIGNDLVVLKADGIHRLEADGTVTNLLPDLTAFGGLDFGRNAWAWNNRVFIPIDGGGLWELETITWTVRDISFSNSIPEQPQYHGRVVGGHGDPTVLYVLVEETANTRYHVLKTANPDQTGFDYNWSHVTTISYTTATDLDHSAILLEAIADNLGNSHHRLWVGTESTGSNQLPSYIPHDTHDDDDEFASTDGEAYTVAFDAGFPNIEKRAQKITLNTANLGAVGGSNHFIDVRYRIEGGSWLYVHTGTGTNTSDGSSVVGDSQTINFNAGITFRRIEFRFTLDRKTTGDKTTPELHDSVFTCQLRTDAIKTIPLTLYLANGQRLLNGMFDYKVVPTKRNQLRTWNAQAAEVVLTDTEDGTRNCVFLPGVMRETEVRRGYHSQPEYIVDVLLGEVG